MRGGTMNITFNESNTQSELTLDEGRRLIMVIYHRVLAELIAADAELTKSTTRSWSGVCFWWKNKDETEKGIKLFFISGHGPKSPTHIDVVLVNGSNKELARFEVYTVDNAELNTLIEVLNEHWDSPNPNLSPHITL